MHNELFPQGLALGQNFCNRGDEQEYLLENIRTSRATLLMFPRRYGKTSLVTHVIHKSKLAFASVDLYSELDETEIQNSILTAIGKLVFSFESTKNKAIQFVTEFFSGLKVSFRYQNSSLEFEVNKPQKFPAKTILSALQNWRRF